MNGGTSIVGPIAGNMACRMRYEISVFRDMSLRDAFRSDGDILLETEDYA